MALVENDCGCKIDYDLVGHGSMTDLGLYKNIRIVYCPTHAAAPDSLEALVLLVDMSLSPAAWDRAMDKAQAVIAQTIPLVGCEDCGLTYQDFSMDVTIPNNQWIELTGYTEGQGLLCGACIIRRGAEKYTVARLKFE